MTTSIAAVRFDDGLIMFSRYQDTADVLSAALTDELISLNNEMPKREKCSCGRYEKAEAATWSIAWNIEACRYCKVVVSGRCPYGLEGWGGVEIEPPAAISDSPKWWADLVEELKK